MVASDLVEVLLVELGCDDAHTGETNNATDPVSENDPVGATRAELLATFARVSGRSMGTSTVFRELTLEIMHKVWSRPHLSMRERRLITIAVLTMEGEKRELDVHVRAALESGDLDADDVDELSIQLAMYGGWPRGAAIQAVHRNVRDNPGPAPTND